MNYHNFHVITSLMRLPTPKIGLRASNKSVSCEICGHVSVATMPLAQMPQQVTILSLSVLINCGSDATFLLTCPQPRYSDLFDPATDHCSVCSCLKNSVVLWRLGSL